MEKQQQEFLENLLRLFGALKNEDLYKGIEGIGKEPTHKGPICQARIDGFNVAKGIIIDILNKEIAK